MSEYKELMEQYRKKLLEGTSDYSQLYKTSAEALMDAQNAIYQSKVADLEAELPAIGGAYDTARSKAYRNAKLTAGRDNEALAAMGLAGNLQQSARSGLSESSRIAADNALRENINLLNDAQIAAEADVRKQIRDAGTAQEQALAGIFADHAEKQAAYEKDQRDYELKLQEQEYAKQQDQRDYELKLAQQEYAKQQDQLNYELKLQQYEAEQLQNALQAALKEVDVFGRVMTQQTADVLGVPVGTLNYTAQLAADKLAAKSSGGGRSSSKGSSEFNDVLNKAKSYLSMPTDTYSASYNAALHGINVSALPAYQANEYLKGLRRNRTITEKEYTSLKNILGI